MIAKPTVLVVDDDAAIRELVRAYLRGEGYRVLVAANGAEALALLDAYEIHLIVLDVMMEPVDGIQACLSIRRERQLPIILLSARVEDLDKIHGLAAGADDYVTKPFKPLELVARVKSQLRRYLEFGPAPAARHDEIVVDDLVINTATREVTAGGRPVGLTPKEFAILELLARRPGVVMSAEHIYERVWGATFDDSANTVMVHIRKLREKLEEDPRKPRYIKTVWGVGYRVEK